MRVKLGLGWGHPPAHSELCKFGFGVVCKMLSKAWEPEGRMGLISTHPRV